MALLVSSLALTVNIGGSARQNRPADPPPGRLLDVGGRSLHIRCVGPAGTKPTVILEAGGGDYSNRWTGVQDLLALPFLISWAFSPLIARWVSYSPPLSGNMPIEEKDALAGIEKKLACESEAGQTGADNQHVGFDCFAHIASFRLNMARRPSGCACLANAGQRGKP